MKILMIIIDEGKKEELEAWLAHSGVVGYTEISRAFGMGLSGPRLGSGAFPKTSAVVFTILTEEALNDLRARIDDFCKGCGESVKIVAWDVEEVR